MYYRDYDSLAIHFEESHFRCKEPQCLEKLFIVFDTEGALEYHMEKEHTAASKAKFGKTKFNASNLLSLKFENAEEDDFDEEEKAALESMGMDIEVVHEVANEMQRQGMQVPELVLQLISKAKAKKEKSAEQSTTKIVLRDNQGQDMTRIVLLDNPVSKGRW